MLKGSNQYIYKRALISEDCAYSVVTVLLVAVLTATGLILTKPAVTSPCPDEGCQGHSVTPKPMSIDEMVDFYSDKYGKTPYQKNRIKALLHYLLLREQNYGGSTSCGDGGLACGPLQFHEATYQGYRSLMIKAKLVSYVGSRLSMNDAIETTAWAISTGREQAWGPVYRGEIKL